MDSAPRSRRGDGGAARGITLNVWLASRARQAGADFRQGHPRVLTWCALRRRMVSANRPSAFTRQQRKDLGELRGDEVTQRLQIPRGDAKSVEHGSINLAGVNRS